MGSCTGKCQVKITSHKKLKPHLRVNQNHVITIVKRNSNAKAAADLIEKKRFVISKALKAPKLNLNLSDLYSRRLIRSTDISPNAKAEIDGTFASVSG